MQISMTSDRYFLFPEMFLLGNNLNIINFDVVIVVLAMFTKGGLECSLNLVPSDLLVSPMYLCTTLNEKVKKTLQASFLLQFEKVSTI